VTTLRIAQAGDNFYPKDSYLFQYESTYKFNTVPNTPLKKGQVRVGGALLVDGQFQPLDPYTFAIVGGRGPTAWLVERGHGAGPAQKLLDIQL